MDPTRLLSAADCRYVAQLGARIVDVRDTLIANGTIGATEVDSMFHSPLPGIQNVNLDVLMDKDRYLQSIAGQIMESDILQQAGKCLEKKRGKQVVELNQYGLLILSPKDRADIDRQFLHSDWVFNPWMSTLLYPYHYVTTSNNQLQPCIMALSSCLPKG